MERPALLWIELFKHAEYFHENLRKSHILALNKILKADWILLDLLGMMVCVSKDFKDKLKGYRYSIDIPLFLIIGYMD